METHPRSDEPFVRRVIRKKKTSARALRGLGLERNSYGRWGLHWLYIFNFFVEQPNHSHMKYQYDYVTQTFWLELISFSIPIWVVKGPVTVALHLFCAQSSLIFLNFWLQWIYHKCSMTKQWSHPTGSSLNFFDPPVTLSVSNSHMAGCSNIHDNYRRIHPLRLDPWIFPIYPLVNLLLEPVSGLPHSAELPSWTGMRSIIRWARRWWPRIIPIGMGRNSRIDWG